MKAPPKEKVAKFNFEEMKKAATSDNPVVRKNIFTEYFTRFGEFPSYLFDNENGLNEQLSQTITDLKNDPETTSAMQKGLALLLNRLSS
jgi:hypothetical protein